MNKKDDKTKVYRFTPEELGLERIVINGHRYIDVTPLWIDPKINPAELARKER